MMTGSLRINRRDSLIFGSLSAFGLAHAVSGARVAAWQPGDSTPTSSRMAPGFGVAKRCVMVWLDGGPSHLEMFDPKPEAASEIRGPLGVIRTSHTGEVFGEGLQRLATRAGRFTLIRSMTSPVGEHNLATQYALSGHVPGGRVAAPAFMLTTAPTLESHAALPTHIAVPDLRLGGGSKLTGFHGSESLPWSLGTQPSDPDFKAKLWPGGPRFELDRLARRRELLGGTGASESLNDAIELMERIELQQVFDLDRESPTTRQRYGGKPVGQNCLLARRLLEAGVPMVTINNPGWDTHERLQERLHDGFTGAKTPVGLIPSLDHAVASLLDDLQSNGLLDETLVIVMGEFGRTPKINTQGGRDHWARAYSVLLAGAGTAQGVIHGTSDRTGETVASSPVTPSDLVATFYHLFGLDPHQRIPTPDGQQMSRVPEGASVVSSILA
jgi:hypothetical protein